VAVAVEQEKRRLDRQRGNTGTADGGQIGEDLRLARLGTGGCLYDAGAGAHQFDRLDRLDQEIGDPHLQELACHLLVEGLRDDHHRRPVADARHQALQRRQLVVVVDVEIDDHDGGIVDSEGLLMGDGGAGDDAQLDLRRCREGGLHRMHEFGIGGQDHHHRLAARRLGSLVAHGFVRFGGRRRYLPAADLAVPMSESVAPPDSDASCFHAEVVPRPFGWMILPVR
jgi:hypothetical protein